MTYLKEDQLSLSGNIASLYLLRGLAALSVCCFHYLPDSLGNYPWLKSTFSYGYLGLDLFFIISGFIIPYSMFKNNYSWNRFPKFLLKRSARIEPPYIMSFLLIILVKKIACGVHNWQYPPDQWIYAINWKQFGLHFLYLNQYFGYESYTVVYWTLAIEFQFYLLVGLLYPIITNSKKIIALSLFGLFCTLIWFQHLPYNWFIFQYGYLFIAGILIFLYTIRYVSFKSFVLLLIFLLSLIYFKDGIDVFFVAIFGAVTIITIKRRWKISDFFGKISYSFYLTHLEAGGWFIILIRGGLITNNIALRVIGILFAIAFATGFYCLFEKPSFRLSKKILYKQTNPPLDSGSNIKVVPD